MMVRILIIDDEEGFRSMLRRKLEKEDYEVLEAPDGKVGLKIVNEKPVDLVITDLIMPEKEGIEVIMNLKKEHPQIPIIAISGGGRSDPSNYLLIAKEFGAQYTFEKPLDWEPFMDAVKDLVN